MFVKLQHHQYYHVMQSLCQ